MSLWLKTQLRRRRDRRRAQGKGSRLPWLTAVLLLTLVAVGMQALRPLLTDYAANDIEYAVTTAMEQAVSETATQYAAVSALQTDDTGVMALTTDSAAVDALRAAAVERVYAAVSELEQERNSVPLGTLLDPTYFAGFGPPVSYGILGLGKVRATVDSSLEDAGINQTIHRMTLTLRVQVDIHALGQQRRMEVKGTYPLSETVIVGDVPLVSADFSG